MKILQISTELVHSGAEKIVYDLSVFLKNTDNDVKVACVKDIRGEVGAWLGEKDIPVYWVDLNYKNPLMFIRNVFKFILWVRREEFDVLHAHQFHANVIGRLAVLFSKSKLVSTVHLVERRFRPWHFWFDSLTAFLCKKEIGVSEAVKEFTLKKTCFMKNKLTVIYNGIETHVTHSEKTSQELKQQLKLPLDKYLYGAVGRLSLQKGFCYLITAFGDVLKKYPESHLFIVGEGPERKTLETLIEELGLASAVTLVGYSKEVDLYYQVMDSFVMPSLFEGFGLVAAEAMVYEVPVLVTQVDSLPEIVEHEKTGLLINEKSSSELFEKMIFQQENPEVMAQWAKAGKASVEENFSLKAMLSKHLKLYEELR